MATAGPNSAGTGANDASVGERAWTNPGNITASDDTRASTTMVGVELTTQYLKATNFGFSIPSGATINGITVNVEKQASGSDDYQVRIVKGGTIGATDRAKAGAWGASDTSYTYGSSSDLWGETWTDADINSSTFGFVISAERPGFKVAGSCAVDHITITIDYTAGGASFIAKSNPRPSQAINRASTF